MIYDQKGRKPLCMISFGNNGVRYTFQSYIFLDKQDNIALDVAPTYADLDLPLKICARDTIGLSY